MTSRLIDLSHVITAGMQTYPGLPVPIIEDHLSREAALEVYGPGNTFQIGLVTMCTNTGTYLDVPFPPVRRRPRPDGAGPGAGGGGACGLLRPDRPDHGRPDG